MITNHIGHGLRNDEKPFAHKIPPGGNWRDLTKEEQLVYWNGNIPKSGGATNGLRRRDWCEPAGAITATPLQKLSCQIHPGKLNKGGKMMEYNVTPTLPNNGFTVAELFCGGGLMAVGLKASGFSLIWANDFDKRAVESYRHNIGEHVVLGDITRMDPDSIPASDDIAGGPPCQDYSVAGKGEGDKGERGKLVWTYLNIISKKQPKAFIFENVKGLVGKRHRHTFDALLEKFDEIGYTVSWQVLNAWDYGVAQKRERVFIVGIRKDLGFSFSFPEPDPEDYRTQVLRDVIGDLPEPVKSKPLTEAESKYQKKRGKDSYDELPARAKFARADNGYHGTLANHNEASNRTPPNPEFVYAYDQSNRVQKLGNASATITAHHNSGQPIHPTQAPRRFTVRECLRIQSAPDWYVIPENISLSAAYRIVGNGVASRVAWYLGKALAEQLKRAKEAK